MGRNGVGVQRPELGLPCRIGEWVDVFGRLTNWWPVMTDRAHGLEFGHTRAVAGRHHKTVAGSTGGVFDRGLPSGVLLQVGRRFKRVLPKSVGADFFRPHEVAVVAVKLNGGLAAVEADEFLVHDGHVARRVLVMPERPFRQVVFRRGRVNRPGRRRRRSARCRPGRRLGRRGLAW